MNSDIKTEWIKRLREPGRKQIEGKLHTRYGQCCLGVLCEIAAEQGVVRVEVDDFGTKRYCAVDNNDDQGYALLPVAVAQWAELDDNKDSTDPMFIDPTAGEHDWEREIHLSSLNDSGKTFPEIADIIERKF